MKKVFYASVGVLLLVLIFLLAYNVVFRHNENNPVANKEKKEQQKEDGFNETLGGAEKITSPLNESLLGATAGDDGIYYYSFDDRSLKKYSTEGKGKEILMSNFPGTPTRILWSPKHDQVLLLLSQTGRQDLWYFADLRTKTLVPLKPEMSRLAWDNLGDKILYQYTDPRTKTRSLNISDPNGENWKRLADLNGRDSFFSSVPKSTLFSFWSRSNALEETSFETLNVTGENRQVLLTEKFGADYLWSPDGTRVLVSTSDQRGGHSLLLNIMNQNGGEFKNLAIPTLVSKVVWSKNGNVLYYALPGALPENAVLPNDYFDRPIYTKDTFWKIDLENGKRTRLLDLNEASQAFDSTNLFLSPSEDVLYFTDRQTKRLYRIDL